MSCNVFMVAWSIEIAWRGEINKCSNKKGLLISMVNWIICVHDNGKVPFSSFVF